MKLRTLLAAGLVVVLCGCGGSDTAGRLPLVKVKGKLYVDNKPFGPALLQLMVEPASPTVPVINGYVKEDGTFELQTYEPGNGAPEGNYTIVLAMDPMRVGNFPVTKPQTAAVKKGSGPLEVKLESTGETTNSPFPVPPRGGGMSVTPPMGPR